MPVSRLVVAGPDVSFFGLVGNISGTVQVQHVSGNLQSAGLGMKQLMYADFYRDHRLFLVGGYRFFRMDEGLNITSSSRLDLFQPLFFTVTDNFTTRNLFNGGEVGLASDLRRGRFTLETQARIAIGNMRQVTTIGGDFTLSDGTSSTTTQGGLLTAPSNIGQYKRDMFTVIPELNIKLGFQVFPWLRTTVGYNFTYVSNVMRPGHVMDLSVGRGQPLPMQQGTDFWLQGITGGIDLQF